MSIKELLVFAEPDRVEVRILVPKQRGEGFLKVPFGHHNGPLSDVAAEIGYDLFGLDGSLDVQTGFLRRDAIGDILANIMPAISKHYGIDWRLIDADEFWATHPLKDALK